MAPENANVFVVEHDRHWGNIIRRNLVDGKHKEVIEATTLEQAMLLIEQAKELRVNVAVLGSLVSRDRNSGEKIASALREAIPDIKIVFLLNRRVGRADAFASRANFNDLVFQQIIRDL